MRTRITALAAAGLAVFVATAVARESRELDARVPSVALAAPVHALVVLPADYETSGERYPVLYFLHGLPATSTAYQGHAWLVDALARAGRAILVIPQGARAGDADPEYLNWGRGRNWEDYVARELPAYVDAHFRTIRSRAGRAILGLSAGGYGATQLGFHHLDSFSVIESWSGYFHATDPSGTKALDVAPSANVHRAIATLGADERRRPTFFAFYVGRGDARFRAENVQLDRELDAARVPHVFAVYPGAHEESVWQAHATAWLSLALRHLAGPAA